MKKLILVVTISFFIVPEIIHAQFSLRPQPLPRCKIFLISEIGYYFRFTSPPETRYEHPNNIIANLGLMVNLSEKIALGASGYAHGARGDTPEYRIGIKARGRWWLDARNSLNLSFGIITSDWFYGYMPPGFTGDLSLGIRDIIIIELIAEAAHYDFYSWDYINDEIIKMRGNDIAFYTGIKLGSGYKGGFIVNTAIFAIVAILSGLEALAAVSN